MIKSIIPALFISLCSYQAVATKHLRLDNRENDFNDHESSVSNPGTPGDRPRYEKPNESDEEDKHTSSNSPRISIRSSLSSQSHEDTVALKPLRAEFKNIGNENGTQQEKKDYKKYNKKAFFTGKISSRVFRDKSAIDAIDDIKQNKHLPVSRKYKVLTNINRLEYIIEKKETELQSSSRIISREETTINRNKQKILAAVKLKSTTDTYFFSSASLSESSSLDDMVNALLKTAGCRIDDSESNLDPFAGLDAKYNDVAFIQKKIPTKIFRNGKVLQAIEDLRINNNRPVDKVCTVASSIYRLDYIIEEKKGELKNSISAIDRYNSIIDRNKKIILNKIRELEEKRNTTFRSFFHLSEFSSLDDIVSALLRMVVGQPAASASSNLFDSDELQT